MVHVSADLSLWLDVPMFCGYLDTKACPPIPSRLFLVPPGRKVRYGMDVQTIGVICQEQLKIEVMSYYSVL